MGTRPLHLEDRWRPRRVTAAVARALIFIVPIAAGFLVGGGVAAVLPPPVTVYEVAFWWIAIISVSTVTATAVDRVARRLLPLTVLLRMTMLFPDAAPSRLRTARRAGNVTELRRRVAEAGRDVAHADLGEVAELVLALSTALSNHDRRTRGHSERTRVYTDLIAEEMRLSPPDRDRLRWAALLHDVGKLEVPAEILNKDSALNDEEWNVVKQHPVHGMRLVAPLIPWLGEWAETIEHHHERYDGTGYPHGLRGEEICLGARIVSVADAFDVMTSGRSYQSAMTPAAARAEITSMAGVQFDPRVARALMNVSLGKLRWSVGPLAGIAQIPFIRGLPQLGRDLAVVLTTSAIVTTGFATGVIPAPTGVPVTPAQIIQVMIAGDDIRDDGRQEGAPTGIPLAAEQQGADELTAESDGDSSDPTEGQSGQDAEPPTADEVVTAVTTTTTAPATTTTTASSSPTARNDAATTNEDTAVLVSVLANDDDPDDDLDPSSLAISTHPANGAATVSGGAIRYVPDPDFNGTDSLGYRICDLGGRCAAASVSIEVRSVNDPPVAPGRSGVTEAGDVISIPLGYSDPDGDSLTCALAASPSVGAATVPSDCSALRYSAPTDYDGTVAVTINVSDGTVQVTGTVTITVNGVLGGAVTANDDRTSIRRNGNTNVSPLANDEGPLDASTLSIDSVTGGTVTILGSSGRIRFDAASGFTGTATVTYTICSADGSCDSASIRIEVG